MMSETVAPGSIDYSEISFNFISLLYRLEDQSSIPNLTTEPDDERPSPFGNNNLINMILEFIQNLKNKFNSFLADLFDFLINELINYSHITGKKIPFNFKIIFEFFKIFGLLEIPIKTINRIAASIQWKVIPIEWIDKQYIVSYKENLIYSLINTNYDESLADLIKSLSMIEKENLDQREFQKEIDKIVNS